MKRLPLLIALLCSTAAFPHTPVCRCELNDNRIDCKGGYHDGSKAIDVSMSVTTYGGEVLATGKLNKDSRFNFSLPNQPFYVLMDAGPGEMFEVDWRDIAGIDPRRFNSNNAAQ